MLSYEQLAVILSDHDEAALADWVEARIVAVCPQLTRAPRS
ncbi:MAG: hypothetical protein JWO90_684 [Solirubrobacterales bacterium]|jgi:hypothetical protein|nr:hypothetical protein [Solirubrobacterales bacterium]